MAKQSKQIEKAIEKARKSQDKLTKDQVFELKTVLKKTSKEIKSKLLEFENMAPLSSGKIFRMAQLKALKYNIDSIIEELNHEFETITINHAENAFRSGISDGISEYKTVRIPGYSSLSTDEIKDLTIAIFSAVDKDALKFLTQYRLELMGDVKEQLKREIKQRITGGIALGKSTPEIVNKIGRIIDDPEDFRKAGKTVFKSVQQRLQVICRTEINRAHNEGRLSFYQKSGVKKVQWLSALDNRTCPDCSSKHGQVYDIDNFNAPPSHANCRCTISSQVI